MKNKVLTYGLLAVVLGVWGYIIYRIVVATGDGDAVVPEMAAKRSAAPQDLSYYELKDSLSLSLAYRDPMWDGALHPEDAGEENSDLEVSAPMSAAYVAPVPKEPEVRLAYKGYIENERNTKKVAILEIEGRQYMLGVRESREGVEALRIETNYVIVRHDGKNKILYK